MNKDISNPINPANEKIIKESAFIENIKTEISKHLIGQKHLLDSLLIALLTGGHLLIEGVPGLAKTLAVKSLAGITGAKFSRIQFTPDLLPADLTGTMIFNQSKNEFFVKKGPLFANIILADEINRAPAKVQSALLEAMQEKQITIGEESFLLDEPFLVFATQNPIEQEGTYPLPEAQVDRFLMKTIIDYPAKEEEKKIIRLNINEIPLVPEKVIDTGEILQAQELVRTIYLDEKIENYIVDIVSASRKPDEYNLISLSPLIRFGASPRASIYLALASRALAFIHHRSFVLPEDVRAVCHDVLRHRIGLSFEAEAENIHTDEIIDTLLSGIPVP